MEARGVEGQVEGQRVERDGELAAALWSAMSSRMESCNAQLIDLGTRLKDRAGIPPSAAELSSARAQTEALGWLVGCVAEGLDSQLFAQRRSQHGLTWLLDLLSLACAQRGRVLRVRVDEPVAAAACSMAELWACAEVLWSACAQRAGESQFELDWNGRTWQLSGELPLDERVCVRARSWSGRAPSITSKRWSWSLSCAAALGDPP